MTTNISTIVAVREAGGWGGGRVGGLVGGNGSKARSPVHFPKLVQLTQSSRSAYICSFGTEIFSSKSFCHSFVISVCFVRAANVQYIRTHVYHSVKKIIHPMVTN